jgi:putative membrane-bound dehydrogenase-like protein
MVWDDQGRLWVSTMPEYPHIVPGRPPNDKIIILEDTDGDGKADKSSVWADGLYMPTGFELGDGGAYVGLQPNVEFLKDTDGDGKADSRQKILRGFGTEDSHHAVHAFQWAPEGSLLFHEGVFHNSQVETPYGVVRLKDAGVFRSSRSRNASACWSATALPIRGGTSSIAGAQTSSPTPRVARTTSPLRSLARSISRGSIRR